ncbi:GPP34 family phosphoprotein [Jiangella sp. DSM 45060]|uniref:GOLPH3/VPS74 family protein n=1 Tax=Jiangella sp. DSM 45060 TaxID=1798224 RepID=UPI00087A5DE5|nr:GPP34 family phosphoprotein [Jiangella sp. DSM 45060]SDT00541.1 Golgi phosphoprotein 3 (GPP34) [Jiangella sp. DSM 45060]
MLIAEDLLLLAYDDETGKSVIDGTRLEYGLAGALLLELSVLGKVSVAGPGEAVKRDRLVVRDATPAGDDVLDHALVELADDEGKKPKNVLGSLRKGLRGRLLDRLAGRGLLRQQSGTVLGIFPTTRWPAADASHEAAVRQRLQDVLVTGLAPDPRTAALVSLLLAVDGLRKVVPSEDRRAVKRRAQEIAEGDWAADAVKKAVQEVQAAVTGAILASTAAGAAGGS